MRRIITAFILLFYSTAIQNAQAQNCCVKHSGEWQTLAMSKAFRESHEPPAPFSFLSEKGSMIQFECVDGAKGNAYYVPSDEATDKVLIIFHEWWGLNDYIKREAVRWQKLLGNVDVYAVDLYDGQVTDDPDIASKLASSLDPKRGEAIVKGIIAKAGRDKLIGTLGWCFGGAWAFTTSVFAGNQAKGCVMYYGFPEQDNKRIKKLQTDVLYIWGSQDQFIKRYNVDQFADKVKATNHKFDLHVFDAVHAFANPSNPKYQPLYSTQAQNLAVAFLKDKMALE
ncbi:MAG: dienelactone hydrolase family protein [Bacteroidetes bacterium]|nr:dienelactone hydrolase family protein [Bacteroidota bacterium]